jgi:DNA-binding NarL/FixJ family response regulator
MSERVEAIRILIADDHPALREGLARAISLEPGMTVVGSVEDGVEAISEFRVLRPDVVLLDLQMPRKSGLQALAEIRTISPAACVVVLSTYAGDARVARALRLGAASYLLKTAHTEAIVAAIYSAYSGRVVLAPDLSEDLEFHRGMETLSAREISVLRLIAAGMQNRRIGEELNISEQTVKSRIKNILAKLNARDRSHAVVLAMRRGFIDH